MSETPTPPIRRELPPDTVITRIDRSRPDDCPAALVSAVAEALDRDVEELPPLSQSIDPDIVESLFRDGSTPQIRERSLSFYYAGHDIIVDSDGVVRVVPLPSADRLY